MRRKESVNILVFNCGSSSQGFKLYRSGGPDRSGGRATASGELEVAMTGKARNVRDQDPGGRLSRVERGGGW